MFRIRRNAMCSSHSLQVIVRLAWSMSILLTFVLPFGSGLQITRIPSSITSTPRKYRIFDQDEEVEHKHTRISILKLRKKRHLRKQSSNSEEIMLNFPRMLDYDKTPKQNSTNVHSYKKNKKNKKTNISNVHELRTAVLDEGRELREIENISKESDIKPASFLNHEVTKIIAQRYTTKSTPGNRDNNDHSKLALSIEGGGMRGAVSAGMAAAIASLGLCNTFDSIYGSSAGSVVGAYLVSRQMCVDVYTEVLPAAQKKFVCKKRLIKSIGLDAVDMLFKSLMPFSKSTLKKFGTNSSPGMNISFILDEVMENQYGVRPLDMEAFRINDATQPLRVVSSAVRDGKMEIACFGSKDFFNQTITNESLIINNHIVALEAKGVTDSSRNGLFACLQAGMTVPGAAGPPVNLHLDGSETPATFFDAFCFEPLPYRSAVEEGATHVLVLRSRPEGFKAKTKPGIYEKAVTPLYFKTHGEPKVADFFKKGGQQYIYLEDLLTLEEGRNAGVTNLNADGVLVPPTMVLYGVEEDDDIQSMKNTESWNRAHLLSIAVPKGTQELGSLEQDKNAVLTAVRGGFAAAFDILAPVIGLDLPAELNGNQVAELMFPNDNRTSGNATADRLLEEQLSLIEGIFVDHANSETQPRKRKRDSLFWLFRRVRKTMSNKNNSWKAKLGRTAPISTIEPLTPDEPNSSERGHERVVQTLLSLLPGVAQVPILGKGLHYTIGKATFWSPLCSK